MGQDTRLGGRPRLRINAEVRARHAPCPMCGYPIDQTLKRTGRRHPLSSVIDEWVPRSKGGQVDSTNCVEMHSGCNAAKYNHWPVTDELRAKCRRNVETLLRQSPPTIRPI